MIKTFKQILKDSKNTKKSLIISFICSFMRSLISVTQIIALIMAVKCLLNNEVNNEIIYIIILMVVCVIGNFITSYFEQTNTLNVSFFMVANKRVELANKLRKLPLGYFNNESRSKTITTLTSTLSGIEQASAMIMIGIVSGIFNTLSFTLVMLIYEYRIGLVMLLGAILYLLLVNYQMKLSRKNAPILQRAQTNLSNKTLSFLEGIKVIKSYSYNDGDKELIHAINESKEANINLTKKSMPTQYLASLIIALFESLMLLLTIILFINYKSIDLIKTIILILFSFMAYSSLNQAGSMLSMIGLLDSSLNEVKLIEDVKELLIFDSLKDEDNNITFKNVSFSYNDNEVLHNINFTAKANNLTAIVGPSGSGKSTICELIPRFRDVNSGEILIGNTNIKNMDYEEINKKISMVFQRVYLFEDTILNNIKFGKPNATMDEVISACKKAQCHDFIINLENGYNTLLSEGGSNLSGGEKQRISIARAILKDSPIIILDEATAAIDADNELEITKAIEELTRNKTVIMIAHKIKTIKNADNIIVLDDGVIKEMGTHEVLEKENGLYKKFIDSRIMAKEFVIKR